MRIEIDFAVGYGPDIETVREIVIDAVRQVEGILVDKAVEALYVRMGDTGRILRVSWWNQSYRVNNKQEYKNRSHTDDHCPYGSCLDS